ncbi:hypothetical protein FGO68_gene12615 [Halteria grandinella]|uniref:Uncharacterized protein n=1 Tax=Halteria grandinella TaxID=5974 RepID=A0A8J8T734_HALGN|nr:hypothetical protein FGO68_gene12615 [Halteria grandinella]
MERHGFILPSFFTMNMSHVQAGIKCKDIMIQTSIIETDESKDVFIPRDSFNVSMNETFLHSQHTCFFNSTGQEFREKFDEMIKDTPAFIMISDQQYLSVQFQIFGTQEKLEILSLLLTAQVLQDSGVLNQAKAIPGGGTSTTLLTLTLVRFQQFDSLFPQLSSEPSSIADQFLIDQQSVFSINFKNPNSPADPLYSFNYVTIKFSPSLLLKQRQPQSLILALSKIGGLLVIMRIGFIFRLVHQFLFERELRESLQNRTKAGPLQSLLIQQENDTDTSLLVDQQLAQEKEDVRERFTFQKWAEMEEVIANQNSEIENLKGKMIARDKEVQELKTMMQELIKKIE